MPMPKKIAAARARGKVPPPSGLRQATRDAVRSIKPGDINAPGHTVTDQYAMSGGRLTVGAKQRVEARRAENKAARDAVRDVKAKIKTAAASPNRYSGGTRPRSK